MNLDEYKNYLVSVYRWPIDNNSDLMEKRKMVLVMLVLVSMI